MFHIYLLLMDNDNEHYNVAFVGDIAQFSVNGDVLFKAELIK